MIHKATDAESGNWKWPRGRPEQKRTTWSEYLVAMFSEPGTQVGDNFAAAISTTK